MRTLFIWAGLVLTIAGCGGAATDTSAGGGGSGGTTTTGGTGGETAAGGSGSGGTASGGAGGGTTTGPGPVTCDDGVCQQVLAGQCLYEYFCGGAGLCAGIVVPGKNDDDACTADTCDGNAWDHVPYAAAEIDDGNVCTMDTCDPASGIHHEQIAGCVGACTNPADEAALAPPVDAAKISGDCGKANLGDEAAIQACIKAGIGLTDACATCFGDDVSCVIANCLNQCIADLAAPACIACRAAQCDPAFDTCSGL